MSDQRQDWAALKALAASAWETFTAGDGHLSIRMTENREDRLAEGVTALLAEVDRLTEALEAERDKVRDGSLREFFWKAKSERAEAALADMTAEQARSQAHIAQAERELADEKRRHAECDEAKERYHEQWMLTEAEVKGLRAGVEALADLRRGFENPVCVAVTQELDALLSGGE